MILMVDNYDSFTYNIVQYFLQLGEQVKVIRNDELSVDEILSLDFDRLVISPGPGGPEDTGVTRELIRRTAGKKPILGVCLGHQTIAHVYGAKIVSARRIMHGKSDIIQHNGRSLFSDVVNPLKVIRYHSLVVDPASLPDDLEVTAAGSDGEIMAIRHKKLPVEGVQFHPESIGSEEGLKLLKNFLKEEKAMHSVNRLLKKIVGGNHLDESESGAFMEQITEGKVTPAQVGSFLTALTMRKTSVEELTGFTKVLRDKVVSLNLPDNISLLDTCGTGGDGSGTFNISTAAAFVVAGAGIKVAKHGNRSITSKSGSADVLEKLGVKIDLTPQQAVQALQDYGFAFLFAPNYHPAFRHIMGPRRELGFRTVFNLMGPMLNPAKVKYQVMGVFSDEYMREIAVTLKNLGVESALIVHSFDGLDEFSLCDKTRVTELRDGWIKDWVFDPLDYGFSYCRHEDLKGGDADENADIIRSILSGDEGFKKDIVLINAAAAIYAAGMAGDFEEGLQRARTSIESGAANAVLQNLIHFSRTAGEA